jgi:mannose-1-phosphate guanylyltransferase
MRRAISRAQRVVPFERIVVVVAERHRRFWEPELADVAAENRIVQPSNRGTGIGILMPLLRILAEDPEARLLILPSDHYVHDEQVLADSTRETARALTRRPSRFVLLGIAPDGPDPDYGWILPAAACDGLRGVERFVEKPERELAARLHAAGALWNSFIIGAGGPALLELFRDRAPHALSALRAALATEPGQREAAFERIAVLDFSKALLQGAEAQLSLLAVGRCGWTDLGTPERVVGCLQHGPALPHTGLAALDLACALEAAGLEPQAARATL